MFEAYRYLWPPRPEGKIPPDLIQFYDRRGWWSQVKKNGTCTVIFASPDGVTFKTRHNDDHKAWTPKPEHAALFAGRPGWSVFVAELLHSKTPHIKNHLYLFDVLVFEGEDLVGMTFAERQTILQQRFPSGKPCGLGAFKIKGSEIASVAKTYGRDHLALWTAILVGGVEDEGIVFKNPEAPLRPCIRPESNAAWQIKVRRPNSNYSF